MRFFSLFFLILSVQACANAQARRALITPPPTSSQTAQDISSEERVEAGGFSFILPEGFIEKGKMHFVSTSSTSFRNIRVLQAPAPFRKLSEQMCEQMTQGFVSQTQGEIISQRLEQRNDRMYCLYVVQNEKFQFANAVTLNPPFALAVNVITETESDPIMESIVKTFRFKAVQHIKSTFFEFPIPEGFVPWKEAAKAPAQALIRKERVAFKRFLGSLVIIPTEDRSFSLPSSTSECQSLANKTSNNHKTIIKSAELQRINQKDICTFNSVSSQKESHHIKQSLIPVPSRGPLVVTCNYDPKDKVAIQGCEDLLRTIVLTE